MYQLKIVRHGPKNNNSGSHMTGVEALLDLTKVHKIISYAAKELEEFYKRHPKGNASVEIETTPIERAKATAIIVYDVMRQDPRIKPSLNSPQVNELIGSSGIGPANNAVNLGPRAMSKIWGEAKKQDHYKSHEGEHRPLYAWCEQGFDNPQVNNPQDPGISLREIACRLGTYAYIKLNGFKEDDSRSNLTLAFGHSGDIEPFLYLCLEMLKGRDGSDPDAMIKHFEETGGALEPLTGVSFNYYGSGGFILNYRRGNTQSNIKVVPFPFPLEILQQQAQWFKEFGKSQEVLEQKLINT